MVSAVSNQLSIMLLTVAQTSLLRQLVAGPRVRHSETGLDFCYVTDDSTAFKPAFHFRPLLNTTASHSYLRTLIDLSKTRLPQSS